MKRSSILLQLCMNQHLICHKYEHLVCYNYRDGSMCDTAISMAMIIMGQIVLSPIVIKQIFTGPISKKLFVIKYSVKCKTITSTMPILAYQHWALGLYYNTLWIGKLLKWTDYVINQCLFIGCHYNWYGQTRQLTSLHILNVFIVQATGVNLKKLFWVNFLPFFVS